MPANLSPEAAAKLVSSANKMKAQAVAQQGQAGAVVGGLSMSDKKDIMNMIESSVRKAFAGSAKQGEVQPGFVDLIKKAISDATEGKDKKIKDALEEIYDNQLEIIDDTDLLDESKFEELQTNILNEALSGDVGKNFAQTSLKPELKTLLTDSFISKVFQNKAVTTTLGAIGAAASFIKEKTHGFIKRMDQSLDDSFSRLKGFVTSKLNKLFGPILEPLSVIKDTLLGFTAFVYKFATSTIKITKAIVSKIAFIAKNTMLIIGKLLFLTGKFLLFMVKQTAAMISTIGSAIWSGIMFIITTVIPFLVSISIQLAAFIGIALVKFVLFTIFLVKLTVAVAAIAAKVLLIVAAIALITYFLYTLFMFFYEWYKLGLGAAFDKFIERWNFKQKISEWWENTGKQLVTDIINEIGQWLGFEKGEFIPWLKDLFKGIMDFIEEWLPGISKAIDVVKGVVSGISETVGWVSDKQEQFAQNWVDIFWNESDKRDVLDKFSDVIKKTFPGLAEAIEGVVSWIGIQTDQKAITEKEMRGIRSGQVLKGIEDVRQEFGGEGVVLYKQKVADIAKLRVEMEEATLAAQKILDPKKRGVALSKANDIYIKAAQSVEQEYQKSLEKIKKLATGGIVLEPIIAAIGEGGDEEVVIPLNSQGLEFIVEAFKSLAPEMFSGTSENEINVPLSNENLEAIRGIVEEEFETEVIGSSPIMSALKGMGGLNEKMDKIMSAINDLQGQGSPNISTNSSSEYIDMIAKGVISSKGK